MRGSTPREALVRIGGKLRVALAHGLCGEFYHWLHIQLHSCIVVLMTSTTIPHPLPEALAELIAQRFRVIGEPMRIRLLDHLRNGPATVGELGKALGTTQQNVSKHLGMLHQAGIVHREKRGNHAAYSIADESVFDLCEHVCGGLRRQIAELDALFAGEVV
jgi:DNA-binding transcriptional ArsR family regulator